MIDCGYKPGSQAYLDHGKSIADVVEHLHASCGGHLDLAILTHEHQDHLNGIWKSPKPYFEAFEMTTTWVAWTEDPTNDLANDLRKRHRDHSWLLAARRELALAVGETTSRSHASTRSSASSWGPVPSELDAGALARRRRGTPRTRSTNRR